MNAKLCRNPFIISMILFLLGGCSVLDNETPGGSTDAGDSENFLNPPVVQVDVERDGSARIEWEHVEGAHEYHIYYASQEGITLENHSSLPDAAMEITESGSFWLSVPAGKEYYYCIVIAVNKFYGQSLPSNEVRVRVWRAVNEARISPSMISLRPGTSQVINLYGDYSYSIANRASWSSSDPSVVTIDPTIDGSLTIHGVSPGHAKINAEIDGLVATAQVAVWPVETIDARVDASSHTVNRRTPSIGIDNGGNALVAWYDPDLRVYEYNAISGWSGPTTLDTMGVEVNYFPHLSMAGNGLAHMVWQGSDGVYAAEYIPESGWSATVQIASEGRVPQVVKGADGDGVSVWATTEALLSSTFTSGEGWSVALPIASATATSEVILVGNENGEAAVVWESMPFGEEYLWGLRAAVYHPETGWGAPFLLKESSGSLRPCVDMAENGTVAVAWSDEDQLGVVAAAIYEPEVGWHNEETPSPESNATTLGIWISPENEVIIARNNQHTGDLLVLRRDWDMGWGEGQVIGSVRSSSKLRVESKGSGDFFVLAIDTGTWNLFAYDGQNDEWAELYFTPENNIRGHLVTDTSTTGQSIFSWSEEYIEEDDGAISSYQDIFALFYPF